MERTIKQLSGHSGSTILLKENSKYGVYVEKTGNVSRNFERMTALASKSFRVPKIYEYSPEEEILKMEYISGLDMRTYLRYNSPKSLIDFILNVLNKLGPRSGQFYMSDMPLGFLDTDEHPFPFTSSDLLERMPEVCYASEYIGDLTLDNIIWNDQSGFVVIDPVTVPYQNVIFDVAKLRQDTLCGWFMRNHNLDISIASNMKYIDDALMYEWPQVNEDMVILMLLRVFRHCSPNTPDYDFISKKVNSLWK